MSALNKYDFAYGSILTIFAAPRRRPEPFKGREWIRPKPAIFDAVSRTPGIAGE